MAIAKSTCSQCAEVNPKQKLQVCGGCLRARYCSKHCAKLAWSGHKPICRAIQAKRTADNGHSDLTGSITAPNPTEAIPVPTGESMVERNLWWVIMDCIIWSSEIPYLSTLYVDDMFYGFVANDWLRLRSRQALPHCPWSDGRVYVLDAFVMRYNAENWIPQIESFTPAIAAVVTLATSSNPCFRFGGLHCGGSHNSDNAESQTKADAGSSLD